jgi:hypothetical protein
MKWVPVLLLASSTGALAASADARFQAMLKRIDPADRLEQVCDYAATVRIGRDKNPYHPDRALLGPVSRAQVSGNTIKGTGGAFRSRGQWYQFSFNCTTTPDRLKVLSFDYKIGAQIPEEKWESYGLYP